MSSLSLPKFGTPLSLMRWVGALDADHAFGRLARALVAAGAAGAEPDESPSPSATCANASRETHTIPKIFFILRESPYDTKMRTGQALPLRILADGSSRSEVRPHNISLLSYHQSIVSK